MKILLVTEAANKVVNKYLHVIIHILMSKTTSSR